MLFWSPWIRLTKEAVESTLSDVPGLYEVKVDGKLVDYPAGRSAMVYYGKTTQSLRALAVEDWFTPEKEAVRAQWEGFGPLVFRWAHTVDPVPEHGRRMKSFIERFGRFPWGNAEDPASDWKSRQE